MERRERRKADAAATAAKKPGTKRRADHKNKQSVKDRKDPSDVGKKDAKAALKKKLGNDNKGCGDRDKLQALMENASMRADLFQDEACIDEIADLKLSGDRAHASYVRELRQVIDQSDVLLNIVDARDPLGSRCDALERMVRAQTKRMILVLNKIDLVPKDAVKAWLKYLRLEFPTVAFKATLQGTRSKLSNPDAMKSAASTTAGECLGADMLIQLLKNYSRSHDIKRAITVGIVGYPNVGKSSVINSLKRSRAVGVSARAGFTTSIQEVKLDKKVLLLDSPGVLFAAASDPDAVLRNCVNIDQLDDLVTPVESIIGRCKREDLIKAYEVNDFDTTEDFLEQVAKNRGKLKKGGMLDLEATASMILKDWSSGKVPFFTMPPTRATMEVASSVVATWAEEFDIENVASLMQDEAAESSGMQTSGCMLMVCGNDCSAAGIQVPCCNETDESGVEMALRPVRGGWF